jgi:sulfur carrier protein
LRIGAARRPDEPDPGHAGEGRGWAMRLIINGEDKTLSGVTDVAGLIAALELNPRKVAVERNLEIVPRSLYASTAVADGDRIEIVHFIGGG